MLYTNVLDAEQTLERHYVCGFLESTSELYAALADSGGHILPETVRRFRVNEGPYRCTSTMHDQLADGGLFAGRTVTLKEFSVVHTGYRESNFKRKYIILGEPAMYLVISTITPQNVPDAMLRKTSQLEKNPYYQDQDEYLASIGAGPEASECYQGNLLVSQEESIVPVAVVEDCFSVIPISACTLCRIALKLTSKNVVVGLCVQFKNC